MMDFMAGFFGGCGFGFVFGVFFGDVLWRIARGDAHKEGFVVFEPNEGEGEDGESDPADDWKKGRRHE